MNIIKPFCYVSSDSENSEFRPVDQQKPNLVLLHGWGLHGGIWQTIVSPLEEYFNLYIVDLPGFGKSPVANGDYTLEYLVESVVSVMPEKCHLLGWSMGGLIATAIASRYPNRVEKLITTASSPCFLASKGNPFGMKKEILETFIQYLSEDFRGTLIKFLSIQTMGSPTQKADIQRLKETVFIHGTPAEKALAGGLELLKDVDLSDELSQLNMPLLRIYGKLDTLVPVKSIESIDELSINSEKELFLNSGHSPFLSQSTAFVDRVVSFLDA